MIMIRLWLLKTGIESNPGPYFCNEKITVSNVNINSITAESRLQELEQFVTYNNIGILGLVETKLDSSINPCLYKLPAFHTPFTRHRDRKGGGVALYVHSSLAITRLNNLECGEIEWIWAKIKVKDKLIIVCCTYIPPNTDANWKNIFLEHLADSVNLAKTYNPSNILIFGDFNAGNNYLIDPSVNHTPVTAFEKLFKSETDSLELSQLIVQPTRMHENVQNIRDLIFVSNDELVLDSGVTSPFSNIDHCPVYATINLTLTPSFETRKTIWDYHRTDVNQLTNILTTTDWRTIIDNDIDTAANIFTQTLLEAA